MTPTQFIITMAGAVFASVGFWQFITKVWEVKYQAKHQKETVERKALKVLLHDRLYQGCRYYLGLGKTDIDGFDNLTSIYETYHELGGNGTGTALYNRFAKLPIEDDENEEKR